MFRPTRQFMRAMLHCLLACATLFGLSAGSPAVSAAPKTPTVFKVGDRAVWNFGGDQYPGTVIVVDKSLGWITLELDDKTKWGESKRGPASWFAKLPAAGKAGSKAPGKSKPAATEANPFETVDERANKNGPRTWSDTTGKHKIEASLVKLDDNSVTLKRKDGKEVSLPLAKLSDADRDFLKSIGGESPEPEDAEAEPIFPVAEVDILTATPLDTSNSSEWSYQPDSWKGEAYGVGRIGLGAKDFFDGLESIFISPAKAKAVVVWKSKHRGNSRVQVCDLKAKKMESSAMFAAGKVPVAMSDDMSRVAAVSLDHQSTTIYVYDVNGAKLTPRISWVPQGDAPSAFDKIAQARFVDKDHLLTFSGSGVVAMWDLSKKVEPVFAAVKGMFGTHSAFSATGKCFAIQTTEGIALFETATGKKLGFLPAGDWVQAYVAFSPSGKQLAAHTMGRVRVWDLTSQKLVNDFVCETVGHKSFTWVNDDTLLVDNSLVIDVAHRVVTWRYTSGLWDAGTAVGDRYLYAVDDKQPMLVITKIPNPEAQALVKGLKPDDLLVIKPGGTISLDVQMPGFDQHQEKVTQELTRQLEANGTKVTPDGEAKLVVSVKPGEVKEVEFKPWGFRPGPTHKVSVAEQITSLEYQIGGKAVWKGGGTISPSTVRLNKDETADAAVARQIGESIASMGSSRLPKFLARMPEGKAAGASQTP